MSGPPKSAHQGASHTPDSSFWVLDSEFWILRLLQLSIPATIIQQRFFLPVYDRSALDLAHHDGVVSPCVPISHCTFQPGKYSFQDGYSSLAAHIGTLGAIGAGRGKVIGEVFLIGRQEIDGKSVALFEGFQSTQMAAKADQNQKRIQRD